MRALRPWAVVLAGALAGCQALFAPTLVRWPAAADPRVRRDGDRLRVYGADFKEAARAGEDARSALRRYLAALDVPGDDAARLARLEAALSAAPPPKIERHPAGGWTAVIDAELPRLQEALGTHYE